MALFVGQGASGFTLPGYSPVGNQTFDAAAMSGEVAILTFVDIKQDRAWHFLKYAEELLARDESGVLKVSVIFNKDAPNLPTDDGGEDFDGDHYSDADFTGWIDAKAASYGIAAPAANSWWLKCVNADYATIGPYLSGFGTLVDPAIYVVRSDSATANTIVDAFQFNSLDSGGGHAGAWSVDDLVYFDNWSGYSPSPPSGYDSYQPAWKIIQYLIKRKTDLASLSRLVSVANANGSWVTDGSTLTFSFRSKVDSDYRSKKALGASNPDHYLLDGAAACFATVIPVKLGIGDYMDDSIGSKGESRDVTLKSDIYSAPGGQTPSFSPDPTNIVDSTGQQFQFEIGAAPRYEVLENAPVAYLRDNLETDRGYPHQGNLACSPDIVLKQNAIAPSQVQSTLGSETAANDYYLSQSVEYGQDNFLYIRAYNRGALVVPAGSVQATVYWTDGSTLPTPSVWNLIGTKTFQLDIPKARQGLIVSPAIPWPSGQLAPLGHHCFIATLVRDTEDPADYKVELGDLMSDIQGYLDVVRSQHRVTWRNFNVVDLVPPPPPLPPEAPPPPPDPNPIPKHWAFRFRFPAAPGKQKIPTRLQVIGRLPPGMEIAMDIPDDMMKTMSGWKSLKRQSIHGHERFILDAGATFAFPEVKLPQGDAPLVWLRVPPFGKPVSGRYSVAVRQLWQGREVGRITWVHRPKWGGFIPGYHKTYPWRKAMAERQERERRKK
jgi:hypothetical protein